MCKPALSQHTHLEPALGQKEVVLNALIPKLLGHVEAHRPVLIIDLSFILVAEDGVGIVDHLELFSSFWVVWVLIRMMPQCQFPVKGMSKCVWELRRMGN